MACLRRVCVFCGSVTGSNDEILETALELGEVLVERGLELVYGGGGDGLMGAVADTVMIGGGRVIGVIPYDLFSDEAAHTRITRLEIVDSMPERKARMHYLADAFVALPGGFGTLEELSETLSWNQLGLLDKPVGVLDVNGFWAPLLEQLDIMTDLGFCKAGSRPILLDDSSPSSLIDRLNARAAGTGTDRGDVSPKATR